MLFDLHEIMEDAAERAGVSLSTGYDYKTARRSIALLQREWSNRGFNLYSIEEATITLDPMAVDPVEYALPSNMIDITDAVIRTNEGTVQQMDISMARVSIPQYYNTPSKLQTGRPSQFYVKRGVSPSVIVWTAPDQEYQMVYWYLKMLTEPVNGGETPALPDRWVPAFIAGLAYQLAMKRGTDRLIKCEQEYNLQLQLAQDEDRDRANLRIMPWSYRMGR
jgi:hypothetical protein